MVILLLTILVVLAFVLGLFVWAAKKDGEEDNAVQKRLGIRRKMRLGSQLPRTRRLDTR